MAFTRLKDDDCTYNHYLKESTSTLNFILDPNRYYSCHPCRIKEGIVGGNNVSVFKGNLVDLESDLRGQTRCASKCPGKLYKPGTNIQNKSYGNCPENCRHGDISGIACTKKCEANLVHLSECKLINLRPKIRNTGINLDIPTCPVIKSTSGKKQVKPKIKMNWSGDYWQSQYGLYQ
jgi:hypothetical protein